MKNNYNYILNGISHEINLDSKKLFQGVYFDERTVEPCPMVSITIYLKESVPAGIKNILFFIN